MSREQQHPYNDRPEVLSEAEESRQGLNAHLERVSARASAPSLEQLEERLAELRERGEALSPRADALRLAIERRQAGLDS